MSRNQTQATEEELTELNHWAVGQAPRLGTFGVFLFFFVRKLSPELRSDVNPPPFAKEDWPWANICAHFPLLFIWDSATAWPDKRCVTVHPGSEPVNPLAAKVEHAHLATEPRGRP